MEDKKVFRVNLGEVEGIVRSEQHQIAFDRLFETTGYHEVCQRQVDFYELSVAYNVMLCRKCGLRVPYPNTVETWEQLVSHFNSKNK